MFTELVDSPAVLAAVIAILSLLNFVIGALALRDHSRQKFVERDSTLPGPSGKVRSTKAQLTLPFLLDRGHWSDAFGRSADPRDYRRRLSRGAAWDLL